MRKTVFCTAGDTAALRQARNQLLQWGYEVTSIPNKQVTHLLLPVPSFEKSGVLKGNVVLDDMMKNLPEDVVILGGNLPELPRVCVDFLKDEYYLMENATITAHCTMDLMMQHSSTPLQDANVLIIGWGRIGKQLSSLLKAQGIAVTVAARNPYDLQALEQLGYNATAIKDWHPEQYQIIINTVPTPLLETSQTDPRALRIDLASIRGICGENVLWARGLPNQNAPDLSGILIAKTALRYALGKESL